MTLFRGVIARVVLLARHLTSLALIVRDAAWLPYGWVSSTLQLCGRGTTRSQICKCQLSQLRLEPRNNVIYAICSTQRSIQNFTSSQNLQYSCTASIPPIFSWFPKVILQIGTTCLSCLFALLKYFIAHQKDSGQIPRPFLREMRLTTSIHRRTSMKNTSPKTCRQNAFLKVCYSLRKIQYRIKNET